MDNTNQTSFDRLMKKLVKVPKNELERARERDTRRKAKAKTGLKRQK